MEQKLLLKKKSETSKRLAIYAVQKQLQIIKLKEWLLLFGFIGGSALLRKAMEPFPSVEPITFFAILSGWLFGKKKGFIAGASSLYLSNFIMFGGQGPWSIYQAIGFGIAGFLGGFLRKNSKYLLSLGIFILATILFEITVNIGWAFNMGMNLLMVFFTSIPFTLTHLVSNSIFSFLLPKTKQFIEKKGKFDEKEICEELLKKFNVTKQNKFLSFFKIK